MTTYGWQLLGRPEPEGRADLWIGTIYASVNVVNELTRLMGEHREAEEKGQVYESAELQEEIEEYQKASEELRNRYPKVYDTLAEKLPRSRTQTPRSPPSTPPTRITNPRPQRTSGRSSATASRASRQA